jgi:hypothetical protein
MRANAAKCFFVALLAVAVLLVLAGVLAPLRHGSTSGFRPLGHAGAAANHQVPRSSGGWS